MSAHGRGEEFISLCVVVFDTEAGTLRYASAGHPPAWLWHDGEVRPLRATGPLLMLDPDGDVPQPRDRRSTPATCCCSTPTGWPRPATASSSSARSASPTPCAAIPGVDADVLCKSLLEAARDFASRPAHRRRRHPRHPPDLSATPRPVGRRRGRCAGRPTRAAREGNLRPAGGDKLAARRASCSSATGSPCCSTTGSFVEDALLANAAADDLPADGVVTGVGPRRRPAGVRHGQRPDGQGGLVGGAHGREDRAAHRARAAPRAAGLLAGRLGRRPHHRPGRAVPRPPGRGAHLLQPGAAVGAGAADLLPVRAVGRGRRLHPQRSATS